MIDYTHHHHHHHHPTVFDGSAAAAKDVPGVKETGKVMTGKDAAQASVPTTSSNFRQYSWTATSDFQKLMRQLWKYIQSLEDEHYQIYYRKNITEEVLKDYSSAIQEIIPRLAKVQSIINHNARGFPDMMRWQAPTAEPMNTKAVVREGAQDCQEFAVFARDAANKGLSNVAAGATIQSALACQAAASKAAVALQRGKFGDPVCDPATVIAGNTNIGTVGYIVACTMKNHEMQVRRFL